MSKIARTYRKQPTTDSCYDLALERTHDVFDRFDQVSVSFSGGKDSTVCALSECDDRGGAEGRVAEACIVAESGMSNTHLLRSVSPSVVPPIVETR